MGKSDRCSVGSYLPSGGATYGTRSDAVERLGLALIISLSEAGATRAGMIICGLQVDAGFTTSMRRSSHAEKNR